MRIPCYSLFFPVLREFAEAGIAILFPPLTPPFRAKGNTPFYASEISALRKGGRAAPVESRRRPKSKARRGKSATRHRGRKLGGRDARAPLLREAVVQAVAAG